MENREYYSITVQKLSRMTMPNKLTTECRSKFEDKLIKSDSNLPHYRLIMTGRLGSSSLLSELAGK